MADKDLSVVAGNEPGTYRVIYEDGDKLREVIVTAEEAHETSIHDVARKKLGLDKKKKR